MQHLAGLADQAANAEDVNTAQDQSDSKSASADSAPEIETKQTETQTPDAQIELPDLAKFAKFKFEGKEMTFDELKKAYMRHSDYTKKTQELAQERKYMDNLSADLEAVRRNPSLLVDFKRVYPEKYHTYLDYVLRRDEAQRQEQQQPQTQELPREVLERLARHEQVIESFQQKELEAEQARIEAHFDSLEKKFTSKYPQAELGQVYHLLQTYVNNQRQENPDFGFKDISEKEVEAIYKQTHEYFEGKFKSWNEAQVKRVKEANKMASDIPRGGTAPLEGRKPMKLKDVADHILNGEQQL